MMLMHHLSKFENFGNHKIKTAIFAANAIVTGRVNFYTGNNVSLENKQLVESKCT